MIAGELPPRPTQLSPGTGPATIDRNVISTNISNDDGGGIRLLMTSGSNISANQRGHIRIRNNPIANTGPAHAGGAWRRLPSPARGKRGFAGHPPRVPP